MREKERAWYCMTLWTSDTCSNSHQDDERDCDSFEFTSSFFFLSLLFFSVSLACLTSSATSSSSLSSRFVQNNLSFPLPVTERERETPQTLDLETEREKDCMRLKRDWYCFTDNNNITVHPLRFFIAFQIVMNLRVKREEVPSPSLFIIKRNKRRTSNTLRCIRE